MQHHLDAYNKTRQQETTIILASFPGHKATSILHSSAGLNNFSAGLNNFSAGLNNFSAGLNNFLFPPTTQMTC